jgi:hypothetical protein
MEFQFIGPQTAELTRRAIEADRQAIERRALRSSVERTLDRIDKVVERRASQTPGTPPCH